MTKVTSPRAWLRKRCLMESDVIIQEGSLQLDGKSSIGMMKIPLDYPVSVYLIDKKGINETSEFIKRCMAIGIVK